jgi:prepilin-type N-terminal cleavage/methylation domain-containing protein
MTLVELLVVIAVIGIIAAIAITPMAGIFETGRQSKNRRNAQSIVSTYNSARASGHVYAGAALTVGSNPANTQAVAAWFGTPRNGMGVNATNWFGISLTAAEAAACSSYVTYDTASGMLHYSAGGDGVATSQ